MIYTTLTVISLIAIAALALMMFAEKRQEPYLSMILILSLITAYTAFYAWKSYSISIPRQKIVEEVVCTKCGYRTIRKPTKGDYILKVVGKCPKCGGDLIIERIYLEKEQVQKTSLFQL